MSAFRRPSAKPAPRCAETHAAVSPPAPHAALEQLLKPFAAPLQFAARSNFEHLDRIAGLEATLHAALSRAAAQTTLPEVVKVVQALQALVPSRQVAAAARSEALRTLWAAYQNCLHGNALQGPAAAIRSSAPPKLRTGPTSAPCAVGPPASTRASSPFPRPAARSAPPLLASSPITQLRGVGPRLAELLDRRGIDTVGALLAFLPRRYQGQSGMANLSCLSNGVVATVEAEVRGMAQRYVRGRRSLEVVLGDATGTLHLAWFRVPGGKGFAEQFTSGVQVRATGTVKRYRNRLQMVHPQTQIVEKVAAAPDFGPQDVSAAPADAVVPLYLEVEGLHPLQLRRIVAQALPACASLEDPLPEALRRRRGLCSLGTALQNLHAPPAQASLDALQGMRTPWQQRLIYDELLLLQLSVLRVRGRTGAMPGRAVPLPVPLPALAGGILPFTPTGAQLRVLGEIDHDLRLVQPMQRLLQGDVGSGKTAVALTAAAALARAGLQTALMVPTELLAEQHARTAAKLLTPLGISSALLTGSTPAARRRSLLADLRSGALSLLIGTHAVIQDTVVFAALALGIVDEQHRFGVLQRAQLQKLGRDSLGTTPHMLVMTATPIPRTLALTVYGDLDTSVIDELPPGRTQIITKLYADRLRDTAYSRLVEAVAQGRQAYVVYPLVESSDKEGMSELRDATGAAQELAAGALQGLRLGLLHGRLHSEEKDAVMRAFAAHELDVLVATTVIEVGIDVPNATVMVIENAERFGLSQLHQLRGRVGRGSDQSHCFLLVQRPSEDAWRRLMVMEQSSDGFRIAEEDLAIRGPGDFVGTRQAGLPELSLAELGRDQKILLQARADATALLAHDPNLMLPVHAPLSRRLAHSASAKLQLVRVG
jgi:ATP-dependent DNA helicase RecG